jgi:hypothetical protein
MEIYNFLADNHLNQLGVYHDSGFLNFYDSTGGLLAQLTFGDPSFGASASGTMVANAIAQDTSSAGGTISYAEVEDSLTNPLLRLTVSSNDSTSDTDIKISSVTLAEGESLKVNAGGYSYTYTTID